MIDLGKKIVSLLNSDTELKAGKVYNLIQDDRSGNKFLVVQVNSVSGEYAKDWRQYDDVRFTIVCIDNGYDGMIETVQKLRDKFELRDIVLGAEQLTSIQMADFKENYNNGAYIGTIIFDSKVFDIEQ